MTPGEARGGGVGAVLRWSLATELIHYITCKSALWKDVPDFFDQCEHRVVNGINSRGTGCDLLQQRGTCDICDTFLGGDGYISMYKCKENSFIYLHGFPY